MPNLNRLQVWYDQYLYGVWIGWNQAKRFCMVGNIGKRFLLSYGVEQFLVLML